MTAITSDHTADLLSPNIRSFIYSHLITSCTVTFYSRFLSLEFCVFPNFWKYLIITSVFNIVVNAEMHPTFSNIATIFKRPSTETILPIMI